MNEISALIRTNGFPYPKFSERSLKNDWEKLCNFDSSEIYSEEGRYKVLNSILSNGNIIFKHFNPHFYNVRSYRNSKSLVEYFNNDVVPTNYSLRKLKKVSQIKQASNFRPTIAKYLYEKYCPVNGIIYDYSIGYNQRLLGAKSSENNYTYYGVDPCKLAINAGNKIVEFFNLENVNLYNIGSEDFCPEKLLGKIDFCFSSPPYFNREIFSREKTQAYSKGYQHFLNNYWKRTAENISKLLTKNGTFALNICEKQKKHLLKRDMIKIIEDNGFQLVDTLYLKFALRKLSIEELNKLEGIYLFKRK